MKYIARISILLAASLLVSGIVFGLVSRSEATAGQQPGQNLQPRGNSPQGQPGGRDRDSGFSAFGLIEIVITFAEITAIAAIGVMTILAVEKGKPSTDITLVPERNK